MDVGCQVVALHEPLTFENIQNIWHRGPLIPAFIRTSKGGLKGYWLQGRLRSPLLSHPPAPPLGFAKEGEGLLRPRYSEVVVRSQEAVIVVWAY